MSAVVRIAGLQTTFGAFSALDGLDLEVSEGEVHGLLGPNVAPLVIGRVRANPLRSGCDVPPVGDVHHVGRFVSSPVSVQKRKPNWWLGPLVAVFALAIVGIMREEWALAAILAVGVGAIAPVIFPRRTTWRSRKSLAFAFRRSPE